MTASADPATVAVAATACADRADFLDAMRALATAVSIVTTGGLAGRHGLTVSAVASVSADPPTLLVCINLDSAAAATIRDNGAFCVNVLAEADAALSDVFAGRSGEGDRFRNGSWGTLATGAPVLAGALAAFDCTLARAIDVHSHRICIGQVAAVRRSPGAPLLYCDRAYRRLAPAAP